MVGTFGHTENWWHLGEILVVTMNSEKATTVMKQNRAHTKLYHLESRWRNSHVLVYHSPFTC